MGLTMAIDLLVENSAVRHGHWAWAGELLAFGTVAGLAGSLLDSLLGATLQETLWSEKEGKILTEHSDAGKSNAEGVKRIGIGRRVLSNSGVNFICGWVMAGVGYWYATRF